MTTSIELVLDGAGMSRVEFLAAFKNGFQRKVMVLGHPWAPNIANVLGEIAKNVFDHSQRKATFRLTVTPGAHFSEAILEICDEGPGYRGPSPDTSFAGLRKYHFNDSSLPMVHGGNAGLGLSMIESGLAAIRKVGGVQKIEYEVTTSPHFNYHVRIRFN